MTTFLPPDKSGRMTETLMVLQRLFDISDAAVFLFDDQERLLYANNQYYDLVRHKRGTHPTWPDIIRDNYANGRGLVIETDDVESWIRAALEKRRSKTNRQFEIDAWDGRWLLVTETLIPDIGLLGVGMDVTREKNVTTVLKQEYQSALEKAETDLLTDMGNRRALEKLRKLLASRGVNHQVTALMIDIDRFKPYNDTLGHLQGDDCLRKVADVIRNSLRTNEAYPIRLGGDEFLILMVDASPSLGQQVAGRIRMAVLNKALPHPSTDSGLVTLSMGLASRQITNSETLSLLIKEADDALYEAKRHGRDRIHGQQQTGAF